MNILNALKQLRDDIKTWVTNNLNALNAKIDEKTIPIDSELSSTSTNPVQNKAIKKAIDNIPTFSGDYNDLTNAPNISEDDSGNMVIADESGNIIFKADADGMHTTAVSINGEAAATEKYVDDAVANIDIPEVDFTGYATETFVNEAIANIDFPETDLTEYATEDFVTTAVDSAKEELSESIVAESDEWKVVDESGNIIFSVDADGAHTTALTLNGESVEDIVNDKFASLVDSAPETLNTLNELAQALGDDPNFATTITTEIGKKVDQVDGKGLSTNDFTNEYKEKLDGLENIEETDPTVPAWAKEPNKPTYTAEEVGLGNVDNTSDADKPVSTATQNAIDELRTELSETIVSETDEWKVVDDAGNIIFSVDADGAHTTSLTLGGQSVEDMIDDKVDKVNGKGLSTNDFTDAYKEKLDGLENISFEESDPTVPAWAKEANKPTYIASEVGALPDTTVLADLTDDTTHRTVTDAEKAIWNAKSDFSGDYNDLKNAPNITEDESNNLVITDPSGNIIFRSDSNGFETTQMTVQSLIVDGKTIEEMIQEYVNATILGGKW